MNFKQVLVLMAVSAVASQQLQAPILNQTQNPGPALNASQPQPAQNPNQAQPVQNVNQVQRSQNFDQVPVRQQYSSAQYTDQPPQYNNYPNAPKQNQAQAGNNQRGAYVSSIVMANGGPGAVPTEVLSSALAANPERRQQASAFMATQTQFNTASVSQAVASYKATATGKPKKPNFFARMKLKKQNKTETVSGVTATAKPGMKQSFKDFFKKIQLKAQKSSTVTTSSIVAPTSTSTATVTPTAPAVAA